MNPNDEATGAELAAAAERGQLHPIPGTTRTGKASRDAVRELLVNTTGATIPEDAARVALELPASE